MTRQAKDLEVVTVTKESFNVAVPRRKSPRCHYWQDVIDLNFFSREVISTAVAEIELT
jgi:hypothetical protein